MDNYTKYVVTKMGDSANQLRDLSQKLKLPELSGIAASLETVASDYASIIRQMEMYRDNCLALAQMLEKGASK